MDRSLPEEAQVTTEETLALIKPDAVSRGLVGEIISRFENRGFEIKKLQITTLTMKQAQEFYSPHAGKAFFEELVNFITSGPVVAMVLVGRSAVTAVRQMVGTTRAYKSPSGTIRGDLSLGVTDNVVHASDSLESYIRESRVIFG